MVSVCVGPFGGAGKSKHSPNADSLVRVVYVILSRAQSFQWKKEGTLILLLSCRYNAFFNLLGFCLSAYHLLLETLLRHFIIEGMLGSYSDSLVLKHTRLWNNLLESHRLKLSNSSSLLVVRTSTFLWCCISLLLTRQHDATPSVCVVLSFRACV